MAKEQAARFLEKMTTEPELQAKIKEAYRQLVCDIARQAGFDFSVKELQQALLQKEYRLADNMLEKVLGGASNNSDEWWEKVPGGASNTTHFGDMNT